MSVKNTSFTEFHTMNCGGKLVDLSTPKVMGIINVTPDSFFDGGKYDSIDAVLKQVENMLDDGATFIDIGGMSSRPGAEMITSAEECLRVLPCIEAVKSNFPQVLISIDTINSETAKKAVQAGACIVNDISGGHYDNKMIQVVAELGLPYIAMHMRGTPETMHLQTDYEDVMKAVIDYFMELTDRCNAEGIKDLVIDPGFGFAKTLPQNYYLLNRLNELEIFDRPILVGLSRKSMVYKLLDIKPDQALNGTTALHTVALLKSAKILRVHDVKEAVETITLIKNLTN